MDVGPPRPPVLDLVLVRHGVAEADQGGAVQALVALFVDLRCAVGVRGWFWGVLGVDAPGFLGDVFCAKARGRCEGAGEGEEEGDGGGFGRGHCFGDMLGGWVGDLGGARRGCAMGWIACGHQD